MADKKISQLTGAATPLAGTEVLPIVQSGSTVKVSAANITAGRAVSTLSVSSNGPNGIPVTLQEITAAPSSATAAYVGVTTSAFPGGANGDLVLIPRTSAANDVRVYVGSGTPVEALVVQGSTSNVRVQAGNLVVGTAGKGIDFSAVADGPGTVITEVLPSYVAGYYNTTMAASTSGTITLGYKTLAYVKVGRMVTVTGEMSIDSVASPVGDISFVLPFTAGPSTGGRMGNADFVVRAYSFAGGLTGTIYGTIVQNSTTCNLIKIEDFVSAGIAANLQAGTTFIFCFSYIAAS